MKYETIETQRLILRKVTQETFDYIYKNLSEKELIQFFGFNSHKELIEEREKYEKGYSMFNKTFLYFQLLYKPSQQLIGWCGYHTWYVKHFRAEIGYAIYLDNLKRLGLMSEAIFPIIEYGLKIMKLNNLSSI